MDLPANTDSKKKRILEFYKKRILEFSEAQEGWTLQFVRLLEMCKEDRVLLLKVLENFKFSVAYLAQDKLKMTREEWDSHMKDLKGLNIKL